MLGLVLHIDEHIKELKEGKYFGRRLNLSSESINFLIDHLIEEKQALLDLDPNTSNSDFNDTYFKNKKKRPDVLNALGEYDE